MNKPSLRGHYIGLHCESTTKRTAAYAGFVCFQRATESGGRFLIADGAAILSELDSTLLKKLYQRQIRISVSNLDVPSTLPTIVKNGFKNLVNMAVAPKFDMDLEMLYEKDGTPGRLQVNENDDDHDDDDMCPIFCERVGCFFSFCLFWLVVFVVGWLFCLFGFFFFLNDNARYLRKQKEWVVVGVYFVVYTNESLVCVCVCVFLSLSHVMFFFYTVCVCVCCTFFCFVLKYILYMCTKLLVLLLSSSFVLFFIPRLSKQPNHLLIVILFRVCQFGLIMHTIMHVNYVIVVLVVYQKLV